ncbi:MAG: response regulator [Acetatifactor sp.]|nr:response regulator [Acetatifactor sp.]
MNVLIVEDEFLARKGIIALINWEENGFQIVGEASDGAEALEILHTTPVDIVITDIKMPIMDGLELMKKAQEEKMNCKFVVLSGFDDFEFVKEAMILGARDYIHKPTMNPDEVIETLKRITRDEIMSRELLEDTLKKWLIEYIEAGWQVREESKLDISKLGELRLVAGVGILKYSKEKECSREEIIQFDASAFEMFELEKTLAQETATYVHNGNYYILIRETPFLEEERQRFDECGLIWEDTSYKSPFANVSEILAILKERVDEQYRWDEQTYGTSRYTKDILDYVKMHMGENITLEVIADQIHITAPYLSKLFQKEMGISFVDYLVGIRIEEAKRLLVDTDWTIAKISESIGYVNEKYFMNLFKKKVGDTPGNYRKGNLRVQK